MVFGERRANTVHSSLNIECVVLSLLPAFASVLSSIHACRVVDKRPSIVDDARRVMVLNEVQTDRADKIVPPTTDGA